MLLGSGISRAAGIPTGWDVVLDLIRQVAATEKEDPGPNPADWYESKFGEAANYSSVLQRLAPSSAERQSLLRSYFEADDAERSEGAKSPTAAHHAIAGLVAAGWIRVIITTNFDRLLENALTEAGVSPFVIASTDQSVGAPPLAHCECVVIKVHGDYLDTRIKNSADELSTFDDSIDELLDQVFDDYGLIVCGWSGEHDLALRNAIVRSNSRRYTTYWCHISALNEESSALISHRRAVLIQIENANSFFVELSDRILAIQRFGQHHPLEIRVAVETLKRYLTEERFRIRLRELVRDSTERLIADISAHDYPVEAAISNEEFVERVHQIESATEVSLALLANGCYWGETDHHDVWIRHLRRVAEFEAPESGVTGLINLFRYPLLLSLYCAGISSIAAGKYELLASLLVEPCRSSRRSDSLPLVVDVARRITINDAEAKILFPHPNAPNDSYKTPLSRYLESRLRTVLVDLIPGDHEYVASFERFEYLASLVCQDVGGHYFAPGSYMWRNRSTNNWLPNVVAKELEAQGSQWPLLKIGLFGGSLNQLQGAKNAVDEVSRRISWL